MSKGDYCCYQDVEWQRYIEYAPVNTRAWVFQERLLSPRVVHFAKDQIFWECHELRASEGFPGGLPPRYRIDSSRPIFSSVEEQKTTDFLRLWDYIVRRYTTGDLTQRGDKLIAVSAL